MVVEVCTTRFDRRHQSHIAISTVICIEWYAALTALRRCTLSHVGIELGFPQNG